MQKNIKIAPQLNISIFLSIFKYLFGDITSSAPIIIPFNSSFLRIELISANDIPPTIIKITLSLLNLIMLSFYPYIP